MTDNQKITLITGASRGLGRNTAIHLAEKGVGVVITYVSNKDQADTAIKEIEANGFHLESQREHVKDSQYMLTFTALK